MATGTLPFRHGESQRQRLSTARLQPFPLSQEMALFKKCPCRGGAGLALVGALLLCKNAWEREGRGSKKTRAQVLPLSDCFFQSTSPQASLGSKFLSQPWIVGKGKMDSTLFQDSCCPEFRGCEKSKGSASSLPWQERGS